MKNIKKISVLMAIFTTTGLSHLIARPSASNATTNNSQSSQPHTINPTKAIAGAALIGPGGGSRDKSKTAGAAALGSMASQSSGDSSGSGGSGSSTGSSGAPTTPPTPTPTTPAPNDQSGQQYAQAPVTGVPTTVPNATSATTPVSDVTTTTATPAAVDKKNDQDNNTEKKAEENKDTTIIDGNNSVIKDQDAILEKIKEINHKDDIAHQALNQASMDLLFNNFLYFKDFIVKNFSKDKMLNLCIEFINQIYPSEQVKVISMNNITPPSTPSDTASTSDDTQATSDVAMDQKPQDMPQEDNAPDNYPQEPSDIQPTSDEFDQNEHEDQE